MEEIDWNQSSDADRGKSVNEEFVLDIQRE